MRRLNKRHAEGLIAALELEHRDVASEITALRETASRALRTVLDGEGPWNALLAEAAVLGDWPEERRSVLAAAADPKHDPSPARTREHLWALITELNELRGLTPRVS